MPILCDLNGSQSVLFKNACIIDHDTSQKQSEAVLYSQCGSTAYILDIMHECMCVQVLLIIYIK